MKEDEFWQHAYLNALLRLCRQNKRAPFDVQHQANYQADMAVDNYRKYLASNSRPKG